MSPSFVFVKQLLNRIPSPLRNRYVLCTVGLLAWISFFDSFDLFTTIKNQQLLSKMKAQKVWYEEQIVETEEDLAELQGNDAKLEKFARERYLMKRDNEDIFVLVAERGE